VRRLQEAAQLRRDTNGFAGLDGTTFTNAPNAGTIFLPLTPFDERGKEHIKAQKVLDELRAKLGQIPGANVLVIQPPPVRGIGTGGGWKLIVEDRMGKGYRALEGTFLGGCLFSGRIAGRAAAEAT